MTGSYFLRNILPYNGLMTDLGLVHRSYFLRFPFLWNKNQTDTNNQKTNDE